MKELNKKGNTAKINVTIDYNMGDYSSEPFVVKKTKQSKEDLDKHGFPEELMKILKARRAR